MSGTSDFIIAVEFIHHRFQYIVDAFLQSEITELEFLEEINYQESWHFPWPHYKAFFDLAKEYKIDVVAINSEGTLWERDQFAAKLISQQKKKVLVFIGELHIVEDKLPKQLKEMSPLKEVLVIHQNLDDVYWNLKPNEHLIRFNQNEYSLQTSPPWIKYESLNYWFDYLDEDPDFDIHEYILNRGVFLFNSSISDNFLDLCKRISQVLKFDIDHSVLENFNLYDHQALEIVLKKVNALKSGKIHDFLEKQLIDGDIFSIPNERIYYCPTYSFNRLVLIAGIHLHQIINDINQKRPAINKTAVCLSYFVQKRVFSYFVSKIINPFRKCDRYQDITNELVINMIDCDSPESLKELTEDLSLTQIHHISRMIGSYMGELLYENLYLKENSDYQFVLDSICETNYTIETLYFLIRCIFQGDEYQSHSKRTF